MRTILVALALVLGLSACARNTNTTVPVAVALAKPTPPPSVMQPPSKLPAMKGDASLDKHLQQEAETRRIAGDTSDRLDSLQKWVKDSAQKDKPESR